MIRGFRSKLAKSIQKWLGRRRIAQDYFDRERARFPVRRVEGIAIYGSPEFARRVDIGLKLLKEGYPFGFSLVRRYFRAIVESDISPELGLLIGVQYETLKRGTPLAQGPGRYAAYLVRRAIGQRQSLGFAVRVSSRSLVAALNRELRAMTLLQCEPKYIQIIAQKIDQLKNAPVVKFKA